MNVLDLFSGIGGFSLGLERAGMRTVAFCEIEPFCREVIRVRWPDADCYDDIRTANFPSADVICGGFPCQDISTAGKGAGLAGERSGLWRDMARAIRVVRPRYVIVENVAALLDRGLGEVLGDLATLGYDAEWDCISAASVGAPHVRDRVWIVAYPAGERRPEMALHNLARDGSFADERWASINAGPLVGACSWQDWEKQSGVRIVVDGAPAGTHRCKAVGNAVVPQIPEIIGRAIMKAEQFRYD